jgi:hypothetical protein
MEHNYKVIFHIGNSHFELESSDQEWINKKESEYLKRIELAPPESLDTGNSKTKNLSSKNQQTTLITESISINEFYNLYIRKNNIKTRPQIALFFVYFLDKIQKKTDIKTGDILNCFKEIGYPNYAKLNYTDILHQNRRKGYLNYVNNYWSLTMTGADYVINKTTSIESE